MAEERLSFSIQPSVMKEVKMIGLKEDLKTGDVVRSLLRFHELSIMDNQDPEYKYPYEYTLNLMLAHIDEIPPVNEGKKRTSIGLADDYEIWLKNYAAKHDVQVGDIIKALVNIPKLAHKIKDPHRRRKLEGHFKMGFQFTRDMIAKEQEKAKDKKPSKAQAEGDRFKPQSVRKEPAKVKSWLDGKLDQLPHIGDKK